MKRHGRHPEQALSAVTVRQLKTPGIYPDGNCLYLVVDPNGAKRWVLKVTVAGGGPRRTMGLGSCQIVRLAEARELAIHYRKIARAGRDPLVERRSAQRIAPTFQEAAAKVHADHRAGWRNGKHQDQWINTLTQYAFPVIGDRRVDQIDTSHVLSVLQPIWQGKPETARRVRQRISTVLDWATAAGHRAGENPVRGVTKGLPRQGERRGHHAAMAYAEVPAFVRDLRGAESVSEVVKLALEFTILTAARTGETIGATWDEVDLEAGLWTIPAARMKGGREHVVPLAPRAVEILQRARLLASDSPHIFPGRSARKPISNMAFLMALRRMAVEATAHGFRSAFRDWAAERAPVRMAMRMGRFKIVFAEQRSKGLDVWREPLSPMRIPKFFDLRADPFERGEESFKYNDCFVEQNYLMYGAPLLLAKWLDSFKEFPPRARAASFSIDQVVEKLIPKN